MVWRRSARHAPAFAVVDLRLGDGNGLDVVSALKRKRPDARAIVLTGYGNIATAVTRGEDGRGGLSLKARRRRRRGRRLARERHREVRTAAQSDVGGSRALGAHPAHLRDVQPQRLGNGAAAEHAIAEPLQRILAKRARAQLLSGITMYTAGRHACRHRRPMRDNGRGLNLAASLITVTGIWLATWTSRGIKTALGISLAINGSSVTRHRRTWRLFLDRGDQPAEDEADGRCDQSHQRTERIRRRSREGGDKSQIFRPDRA